MSSSKIIIIAGMHRSGTSLSANLLKQSGLFIGDDLLSNGFDNKKGHFEDWEFIRLHEQDLRLKGLDTRGLSNIPKQTLGFEAETLEALKLVLKSRCDKAQWGWKEPRTTLYLEAWKKALPDAKCIALYRNYDEVATSLLRRYQYKLKYGDSMSSFRRFLHIITFPINYFLKKREAYRAWCIYNSHILDFKRKYPEDVIILDLNHFLEHYNQVILNINAKFEVMLDEIDVSDIYERDLLRKDPKKAGLRCFSKTKLIRIERELKTLALWM